MGCINRPPWEPLPKPTFWGTVRDVLLLLFAVAFITLSAYSFMRGLEEVLGGRQWILG